MYKSVRFETKADLDTMTVEGLASTFEPPEEHDSHGDIIDRHAFDETILAEGPAGADVIKMLWQHWEPMGVVTELSVDDKGLHFKGRAARTKTNEERLILIKDRAVDWLSIGYRTLAAGVVETFQTPWGAYVRNLLKIRLHEISPVTFGSNHNALITRSHDEAMIETRSGLMVPASSRCMCDVCETEEEKSARRSSSRKAGRSISRKNESTLQGVIDALDEARTKIETGSASLEALVKALHDDEEDEDDPEPEEEEDSKETEEETEEEKQAFERLLKAADDLISRL